MNKLTLSITLPIFFTIMLSGTTLAYTTNSSAPALPLLPSVNPINYLTKTLSNYVPQAQGVGTTVPALSSGITDTFKNLIQQGINSVGGTSTLTNPTSSTTNFSTSDIPSALKSIGNLAINLFIIVIETVAGILKALLPFLSK